MLINILQKMPSTLGVRVAVNPFIVLYVLVMCQLLHYIRQYDQVVRLSRIGLKQHVWPTIPYLRSLARQVCKLTVLGSDELSDV